MHSLLECQLYSKAKKLIRRKIRNFTAFQNILMNEEFIDAIQSIDDLEESFVDILIFDISSNFKIYEESLIGELGDLEEMKNEVIGDIESSIGDIKEMDDEESLIYLEELIEK